MRERDIFIAVLELENPSERAALLDGACRSDWELRRRVERLLAEHERQESFVLDAPPSGLTGTAEPRIAEKRPGAAIGPYKLRERIGEGGMGVVYVAEQIEPVKRKVALKLIKPGMDTRQVVARFEAERQALAMMDHPNIARVFDGGSTDAAQPYFVMELVQGPPITEYCDQYGFGTRERLELFLQVCRAVQHAHQKGIIHRDLKPSNVLVPEIDGTAVPKVIDFGVAKAVNQELTEHTLYTQFSQLVGTPLYMSPEQAGLGVIDVDTRSDIYALGVLLYELLTGSTPFDGETLKRAGLDEMRRIIREDEPLKPSTKVSTLDAQALSTLPQHRRGDSRKLSVTLAGELDWIVMKALEKDRSRRYETASKFAEDIAHYLKDEPVEACPPTATYRLMKLFRKNRRAIVTAAAFLGLLVLAAVLSTWQAIRAGKEADRAGKAELRSEEQAARAEHEAAVARAVNDFINRDLLDQGTPENEPDRDIRLRTVIDRAAQRIDGRFDSQPLVEAGVRDTLGRVYKSLGEYELSERHHRRAYEIRRRELGEDDAATLESMSNMAVALEHEGNYVKAEGLLRRVLEVRRRELGPEDSATLSSHVRLASAIRAQGRYAEAERLQRMVLDVLRRTVGDDHVQTVWCMGCLADTMCDLGRFTEAERLHRQVLEIRCRTIGDNHPETLRTRINLANVVVRLSRYSEAEGLYRQAVELARRTLGHEHPQTLMCINNLASAAYFQRRYAEAEKSYREAFGVARRTLGEEHPFTLQCMGNLANAMSDLGEHSGAEELRRQVLEISRRTLGEAHPVVLQSMDNLAASLSQAGHHQESEDLHRRALAGRRRTLGDEHPDTLKSFRNLSAHLHNRSRYAEAAELRHEVLGLHRAALGEDHPDTLKIMRSLASDYAMTGRMDEALELAEHALESTRAQLGPDHLDTARSMISFAWVLHRAARIEEALPRYREATVNLERALGPRHSETIYARQQLADAARELARRLAKHAQWDGVVQLLEELIDLKPGDFHGRYNLAPVYLWNSDPAAYRRIAEEMIRRFRNTDKPVVAERVAKTCLLVPGAVGHLDEARQLADRAVTSGADHQAVRWFYLSKALGDYRGGDFDSAIDCAEQSRQHDDPVPNLAATAYLIQAMAEHELGRFDEAHASFTAACDLMARRMPATERGGLDENWHDWLRFQILRREAETMLPKKANAEQSGSDHSDVVETPD